MKHKIFVGMAVLAAVVFVSGASILALAAPATNDDPLVTLSYLNGPFKTLVQNDINEAFKAINDRLTAAEEKLNIEGGSGVIANVFTIRNLAAGKSLTIDAGSEVMAESGTVTYSGNLTKITGTPESSSSGTLNLNNMYIATGTVRLTVSSAAKIWIRTAPGSAVPLDADLTTDTVPAATPEPPPGPAPDTLPDPAPDSTPEPDTDPAPEPETDPAPDPAGDSEPDSE